jgi:3-isopropylmalate/(R)-2-methylmalate dehydratase small subunit
MSDPLVRLASRAVLLPLDNVDTDQIIPARYLKAVSRDGLADALFADWRRLADGSPNPDFPLNRPDAAGREILVARHNFGNGSSREHAVWALRGAGFRVVVAASFADIFRSNAVKNGLLPVAIDGERLAALHEELVRQPDAVLAVDLEASTLTSPGGGVVQFRIDPFSRRMLLAGRDELGYILDHASELDAYERRRPPVVSTAA